MCWLGYYSRGPGKMGPGLIGSFRASSIIGGSLPCDLPPLADSISSWDSGRTAPISWIEFIAISCCVAEWMVTLIRNRAQDVGCIAALCCDNCHVVAISRAYVAGVRDDRAALVARRVRAARHA